MLSLYFKWTFGNSKVSKLENSVAFGLPAGKSIFNETVCNSAGICKSWCYASQGTYTFKNTRLTREFNFALTKSLEHFNLFLNEDISKLYEKQNIRVIRLHDSGDILSQPYFQAWLDICEKYPDLVVYTYTKNIPILFDNMERIKRLSNFRFCQSEGSIHDGMIDYSLPWCRVYPEVESLNEDIRTNELTVDGTSSDEYCINMTKGGIGFVYHGCRNLTPSIKELFIQNNTSAKKRRKDQLSGHNISN